MSETQKQKIMKRTNKRRMRKIRRFFRNTALICILAAAGLIALKGYIRKQAEQEKENTTTYSRARVLQGAMTDTVYGTGTTSAVNQPNILSGAEGTVSELRVSIGDEVQAGDILAVIENGELDDEIVDLEFALWELDDEILGTSAGGKLTGIESPVAGRVMAVYAQSGDDALAVFRREGALAVISTDGRMKVELTDVTQQAALGDKLYVTGEGVAAEGTVTNLTRQGSCLTVTINDDLLPMGAEVTVTDIAGRTIGSGILEVNKPMAVSSYGGTIGKVYAQVGKTVKREQKLFDLEDSPLTLKIENLRLQREAAAKSLADAKERRENLIVTAPTDGIVASIEIKEGDEVTEGMLLGSILQGEDMSLTIAVDELDVVSVEPGQNVSITVDALSELTLNGAVHKIAPVGSSSGGVTTYDVMLTFDAAGTGVRSGMNATGEIEIASADNTLYVPVEALMTIRNETYLMVEGAASGTETMAGMTMPQRETGDMPTSGSAEAGMSREARNSASGSSRQGMQAEEQSNTQNTESGPLAVIRQGYEKLIAWLYEGTETNASQNVGGTLVKVEVGMQNDTYAQILSGVSAGDTILYTASSTSSSSMNFGGMGAMSGMGGGMNMRGF